LTFDLNGILGHVQNIKSQKRENKFFEDLKPNKIEGGLNYYHRPNLQDLLNKVLYEKKDYFDIAVWSNQNKENTSLQIKNFLGIAKYNLKFVLFTPRKHPNENSLDTEQIERDLNIIFDKNKEYDENNTIIISNYENKIEKYLDNDLIVPKFHPTMGSTHFTMDGYMYYLYEYLMMMISLKGGNSRNTSKIILILFYFLYKLFRINFI
jgi:hypothetical protein